MVEILTGPRACAFGSSEPEWRAAVSTASSSHVEDFVLVVGAAVRGGHVSVDGSWDATALLVVVCQSEAEQAGACGQVHMLNVLHV